MSTGTRPFAPRNLRPRPEASQRRLCQNHFFSAHIALAVVRRNRNLFLRRHLDPSAHCVLKSRKSLLAQSAQIMKREPTPARQTDIDKNET